MISQLRGEVLEATASMVVLDVSGVGYELGISAQTAASLPAPGGTCSLFTRLQVREDAMTLFGFSTRDERTIFDKLVAVSGVGPRLALAVLSTFSPGQLYSVVMSEDAKTMATVPGVGKKTAQRLILELKSVFSKGYEFSAQMEQLPLSQADATVLETKPLDDTRAALLSMGFSPREVDLALDGLDKGETQVEKLLAAALKRLGMDA